MALQTPQWSLRGGKKTVHRVQILDPATGAGTFLHGVIDQIHAQFAGNKTQYFEGVRPDVWGFHVGGYQVAQKWLKDRKGRAITFDDLQHYRKTIAALWETIRLMAAVDAVIDGRGGWPLR